MRDSHQSIAEHGQMWKTGWTGVQKYIITGNTKILTSHHPLSTAAMWGKEGAHYSVNPSAV